MSRDYSQTYPSIEPSEARQFLQQYTDAFRNLLDSKYRTHKNDFPLYTGWPFEIFAFIVPSGILVMYKTNAREFAIHVQAVKELPKERDFFPQFYTNRHFRAATKKPQAEAEREIDLQLSLESMIEDYESQQSERMEREWLENVKFEVGYYLKYLASAYEVKKESFQNNVYELFDLLENVLRFQNRMETFAGIHAHSLILLHEQILDDMETSIFLAIHGKYGAANSTLRRVLEVGFRGIESDHRLAARPGTRPANLAEWLQDNDLSFAGSGGIIERLLDQTTDTIVVSFFKKFRSREYASIRELVREMYRELSQYVHVELNSDRQIVLGFAEYDANLFEHWERTYSDVVLLVDLIFLLKFPSLFSSNAGAVWFPKLSAEELEFLQLSSTGKQPN